MAQQQSRQFITWWRECGRRVDSQLLLVGVKISASMREYLVVSVKVSNAFACCPRPHLGTGHAGTFAHVRNDTRTKLFTAALLMIAKN